MALDGLGSDDIEVDGVMSRPSDPMPYKRTCSGVFAPIASSVRKSFWKKFLRNGGMSGMSGMSVVFTDRISSRSSRSSRCESDARDFSLLKNKNPQKNL